MRTVQRSLEERVSFFEASCCSSLFHFHCHAQPFDTLSQVLQFLFHAYQQVPGDDHGEAVLSSLAGQQGQVVHGQPSVLSSAAGSPRRSCTSVTFAAWTGFHRDVVPSEGRDAGLFEYLGIVKNFVLADCQAKCNTFEK